MYLIKIQLIGPTSFSFKLHDVLIKIINHFNACAAAEECLFDETKYGENPKTSNGFFSVQTWGEREGEGRGRGRGGKPP